ncbi:MAG: hypothetical protein R3Y10_02975 [Ferrimonas sp.]
MNRFLIRASGSTAPHKSNGFTSVAVCFHYQRNTAITLPSVMQPTTLTNAIKVPLQQQQCKQE